MSNTSQFAGKRIFAVAKENHRRAGSHGFKSFALILAGKGISYETFIEKGGRANDLRWDVAHGHAKIEGGKAKAKTVHAKAKKAATKKAPAKKAVPAKKKES